MGYVVLAVVLLIVLAGVALLTALRRNDVNRAIGELSRETKARDRSMSTVSASTSSRAIERAAVLERRGASTEVAVPAGTAPAPFVPPDPDTIGTTRRQFLNRSIITTMLAAIGTFSLAMLAQLWPSSSGGGFGGKIKVGRISDIQ